MAEYRQCEFYLLRYVPDAVKDEFVNLGVVLLETGEDPALPPKEGGRTGHPTSELFTDVRFTRDWRRVRCLDPEADVELLESFEGELRRMLQSRAAEVINYRGPMSRRDWLLRLLEDGMSGALRITPAKAVLTENPVAELGKLAQMYLESGRHERRVQSGRRVIYAAMREAFESAGVWALGRRDIALANYGAKGDPLKIDFGYRPNGVIRMFQAVSLESDVDAAKVLAFSYPTLREGLRRAENASSDLTAVVEDGLNRGDEAIGFALATLAAGEIRVATMSEMPGIAERARVEMLGSSG
jgi:Protein of unknown function (DUF3037)